MISDSLPRSIPEEQGVSSKSVLQWIQSLERRSIELHSMMIVRHGHVVAEGWWRPYRPDYPHQLFSATKSFTSMAIGFAVTEGLLSIDDSVARFFPEVVQGKRGYLERESVRREPLRRENVPCRTTIDVASIRIRHLLIMSVGHAMPTMGSDLRRLTGSWIDHFFTIALTRPPGTSFMYNTIAYYMLSAIIQKVTGQQMADYLQT
ncbi:MAG: beta-lactamase family protein, partial [Alicyclobacillus sp.]|nr:beta-lactamase family protein [Alicyclobacillus sp.]